MKRQAERDTSPARAAAKRIRERERERERERDREREGRRGEDAIIASAVAAPPGALLPSPPLALLLADTRSGCYGKREARGGESSAHHRLHHDAGALSARSGLRPGGKGKGSAGAEMLGGRVAGGGAGSGGSSSGSGGGSSSSSSGLEYKTLLVSNLGSHLSDEHIEDELFHKFKKFGDVSVKLSHTPELGRVAYVNFRQVESAREARHARTRLVLGDRALRVEPVYVRRRSCTPPDVAYAPLLHPAYLYRQRSLSPGPGGSAIRDARARHYAEGVVGLARERERLLDYYSALEERSRALALQLQVEEDLKPEDDQRATRNLFIGNLDHNVSEAELRQGFEKYGVIEEVVIKRPARGQGCAYAFIKFQNLDMAHRAKVAMQGRVFGGNQVKIGYGKANPTTRLWVGGLGPNVSLAALAREFDRFGSIRTIDYVKGDNFAYIHYESLDAAQAACAQMRGFPLGGPNRRLRVDFAKAEEVRAYPQQYQLPLPLPPPFEPLSEGYSRHRSLERELRARARSPSHPLFAEREREREREWSPPKSVERRTNTEAFGRGRARSRSRERWTKDRDSDRKGLDERRKRRSRSRSISPSDRLYEDRGRTRVRAGAPATPDDSPDRARGRLPDSTSEPQSHTPDSSRQSGDERAQLLLQEDSNKHRKGGEHERNHRKSDADLDQQVNKFKSEPKKPSTLSEYAQTISRVWHGSLVLKNSSFPTNMHILEGGASFFLSLMKDNQAGSAKITQLKIAQRLRLDQPKLDEVTRRIKLGSPDGYTVLLAVQGPMDQDSPPLEPGIQKRLLRNLVTYLRNKQAAGVISLPIGGPKERETGGMLYAFPPCEFSQQYLQTALKTLGKIEEDHLVIVVVKDSL
ncbi:putative RNA-binding protein 15B isoform X1 [Astyanax mexicanus]|uniref:Putative RNA-binding protein 15B isoform X1 n=1 Tax=Astyanax mexicanus TaxID=7994 RepID=A0A8T2KTT0_ASTMX|nr:putative RNA-binding protein 15B isoform X1 [Astyanax mexicanus]